MQVRAATVGEEFVDYLDSLADLSMVVKHEHVKQFTEELFALATECDYANKEKQDTFWMQIYTCRGGHMKIIFGAAPEPEVDGAFAFNVEWNEKGEVKFTSPKMGTFTI